MPSLADTPLLVRLAVLLVLAAAFVALLGVLGLRFLRRGAARFWIVPAATALALLPLVLGAGLTAVLFRQTLSTLALVGSGGRAALAGSSSEAILPLLFGLPSAAMLALIALFVTAIGTSRAEPGAAEGGKALHLGALAAPALAAGLVALVLGTVSEVNARPGATSGTVTQLHLALAGAPAFGLALCIAGLASAARAPRISSPFGIKLLSLSALALSALVALTGTWRAQRELSCLIHTGLTGLPCGVEPNAEATLGGAPAEPSSPPDTASAEGSGLSATSSTPAGDGRPEERTAAVRVGGGIREPKKIKHVNPAYPDIARQARVQGVVILECTIGRDGRVEDVKVLRGIPLLEAAAVDAVKQWV